MANLKQNTEETIRVRVGCNPIHAEVHGCYHRWFSILNPNYIEGYIPQEGELAEPKWTKVFVKSKGSSGLSKIIMKGRIVVLRGKWSVWNWQNVGKVFVANHFEGISYEHVAPKEMTMELDLQQELAF
jgi:hypothetical protein